MTRPKSPRVAWNCPKLILPPWSRARCRGFIYAERFWMWMECWAAITSSGPGPADTWRAVALRHRRKGFPALRGPEPLPRLESLLPLSFMEVALLVDE